ncbi:hypothetical protein MSIMFI_02137 [Mycobacterium simulans]|uniref:hypothetical protein n=1 Tax=Mycobacterium simulans TaxID=627089 RepID=UPI00174D47B8|nr:hypothetical protein [Mycobacterium simulans]SON60641.1 hypothetical protein MSIMFI_02137 [Mycobacterium simulans]
MTTEPLSANLVERYLRTRGRRYFRGQHDAEFFFVVNTHPRRLHVHLEASPAHREAFAIRVTPACFFPATDYARLAQFADRWNARNQAVTAIVHGSSDPRRVVIEAHRCQWFSEPVRFEDFADAADRTIAAAIDLFAALTRVVQLSSATQPLLLDAG